MIENANPILIYLNLNWIASFINLVIDGIKDHFTEYFLWCHKCFYSLQPLITDNGRRMRHPSRRASFVLPAKSVHENQFGKGLWAKIPAEGHTTVTKPERTDGVDGEIVWENRKESVLNAELKEMVESYKTRSPQAKEAGTRKSAREKLDSLAKETAAKLSPEGRKAKPKDRGPEH